MSTRIYVKSVEVDSWMREIERIQSISDAEAREDAFFHMLSETGEMYEDVMWDGDATFAHVAYEQICQWLDAEMRRKADIFLESLPLRWVPDEKPLPIGSRIPILEEFLEGWLLTPADVHQLIEYGRAIDALCEAEIVRLSKMTLLQRIFSLPPFREERERTYRDLWGYVGKWVRVLEKAEKNEVGLLVWVW